MKCGRMFLFRWLFFKDLGSKIIKCSFLGNEGRNLCENFISVIVIIWWIISIIFGKLEFVNLVFIL